MNIREEGKTSNLGRQRRVSNSSTS